MARPDLPAAAICVDRSSADGAKHFTGAATTFKGQVPSWLIQCELARRDSWRGYWKRWHEYRSKAGQTGRKVLAACPWFQKLIEASGLEIGFQPPGVKTTSSRTTYHFQIFSMREFGVNLEDR